MNNKTRIVIGVVIAVLFVIGIVALEQTQPINSSEPTKITNQNNTQIQNNSTDTIEMESLTIVKYTLNNDKSSKVNTKSKSKSVITDKSSKVNTKPKTTAKNVIHDNTFNGTINNITINTTIPPTNFTIPPTKVTIEKGSQDKPFIVQGGQRQRHDLVI